MPSPARAITSTEARDAPRVRWSHVTRQQAVRIRQVRRNSLPFLIGLGFLGRGRLGNAPVGDSAGAVTSRSNPMGPNPRIEPEVRSQL
jgi:hypothetical protein